MDIETAHDYLDQVEEKAMGEYKYFTILDEDSELNSVIFKARTNEGAFLAIYNYMFENGLPVSSGDLEKESVDDISDLLHGYLENGELPETEEEISELVETYIRENFLTMKKPIFA